MTDDSKYRRSAIERPVRLPRVVLELAREPSVSRCGCCRGGDEPGSEYRIAAIE
jgi:hypothetical protein